MREGAEKEFYNARGTRYVRDHATRATVYSEGRPNEKVLPYRMLAKAIIYRSLLDAYTEHGCVSARFFSGPEYRFYAEVAGIRVDGETLLQHFIDRADGRLPSLDSIIEEKGE